MRAPKWAKRLWEGWHHLDAARALFQFVREWLWVVFAAIKWGGGVGTIGISALLLVVGWVSGLLPWLLIGGAVFYTTVISAYAIMQSRRVRQKGYRLVPRDAQVHHKRPLRGEQPAATGTVTGVLGPNIKEIGVGNGGDEPIPQVIEPTTEAKIAKVTTPIYQFETQGKGQRAFDIGGRPQALRFRKPVDKIVKPEDLPIELPCGQGKIVVIAFLDKGFVVEEQNTIGDLVVVERYPLETSSS